MVVLQVSQEIHFSLLLRARPGRGHHPGWVKAVSTELIGADCSLSNCNKEQLSWKQALDVVQISESLPITPPWLFSFLPCFFPWGYGSTLSGSCGPAESICKS